MAATFRLSPIIFDRALQDPEARTGRSQVRLGQTGAHGGGELCAGGEPGSRQRAVAIGRSGWIRRTALRQWPKRNREVLSSTCVGGMSSLGAPCKGAWSWADNALSHFAEFSEHLVPNRSFHPHVEERNSQIPFLWKQASRAHLQSPSGSQVASQPHR